MGDKVIDESRTEQRGGERREGRSIERSGINREPALTASGTGRVGPLGMVTGRLRLQRIKGRQRKIIWERYRIKLERKPCIRHPSIKG